MHTSDDDFRLLVAEIAVLVDGQGEGDIEGAVRQALAEEPAATPGELADMVRKKLGLASPPARR
jgi:hypothetical protein